jgi:hypothetical protein
MKWQAWLKVNLGKRCLAPLTTQDALALEAAVKIAALWSYDHRQDAVARAFESCVLRMQESTRHLAYHVVAQVGNWEDREVLWAAAELPAISVGVCAYEPGGANR